MHFYLFIGYGFVLWIFVDIKLSDIVRGSVVQQLTKNKIKYFNE